MKRYVWIVVSILTLLYVLTGCIPEPVTLPDKPSVVSPSDGQNLVGLNPELKWEFNANEKYPAVYDVYLGEKPDKLDLVAKDLKAKSYTLTTSLKDDTVYYWKVVAKSNNLLMESPVWTFKTVKALVFNVSLGRTGEAVKDVDVKILPASGDPITVKTNDEGKAKFDPSVLPEKFDVEIIPPAGYAKCKIIGFMKKYHVGFEKTVPIQYANLEPDPSKQVFPTAEFKFYTKDDKDLDLNDIKDDFKVNVKITGENHPVMMYFAISDIAGGGGNLLNYGNRINIGATKEATVTIPIVGKPVGENYLSFVYYDQNNVRVEYLQTINITREVKEAEKPLFVPIPASKFGFVNMISYTRNGAVQFYSKSGAGKFAETLASKSTQKASLNIPEFEPKTRVKRGLESAPKGSNLWIEVNWISYDIAEAVGLVGPGIQQPDGYYIYRSFDGKHFTKIGYAHSYRFVDWSAELAPNKKVWYAVSSYYGDKESELVMLGSVEPLDNFNVELLSPAHKATNVSRQPTFSWKPTKALTTSEDATVTYNYALWIYDLVQSENQIVPVMEKDNQLLVYNFSSEKPEPISVTFKGSEGSPEYEDLKWVILIDSVYYYPSEKLEAGKTYNWGVDLAYAEVYDYDSVAYSIAIDMGYGIDPIGVEADLHGQFTTGNE